MINNKAYEIESSIMEILKDAGKRQVNLESEQAVKMLTNKIMLSLRFKGLLDKPHFISDVVTKLHK